jgi:hypothetical protein
MTRIVVIRQGDQVQGIMRYLGTVGKVNKPETSVSVGYLKYSIT